MTRNSTALLLCTLLCLLLQPSSTAATARTATSATTRRCSRLRPKCRRCFPRRKCKTPTLAACSVETAVVPFDNSLPGQTFEDANDCSPAQVTQTSQLAITATSLRYEIRNDGGCPFGYELRFSTNPLDTVAIEELEPAGGDCSQTQKRRFSVTDRGPDPGAPLLEGICGVVLDLHRNIRVLSLRDALCPGAQTGNHRVRSVLSFLEVLAFQLHLPLDFPGFVDAELEPRPDLRAVSSA